MNYTIQYQDASLAEGWRSMKNSGNNLGTMRAAVDELVEAAQANNLAQSYRLVDETGDVVYGPATPDGVRPDGSNSLG